MRAVQVSICMQMCECIPGRELWRELMAEQGFGSAVIAGEASDARWLLSRQSVVVGVSDGSILVKPRPTLPVSLPADLPQMHPQLLDSFRSLPLRNSLPQGVYSCTSPFCC